MRAEKEIRERQERARKAREEHAKAAAGAGTKANSMPDFGGFGAGGAAGTGDFKIPPGLMDMFNDPEVQKCFEVRANYSDLFMARLVLRSYCMVH